MKKMYITLVALLILLAGVWATTEDKSTITAYGEGAFETRPDVVYVSLAVQRDGYTAQEAQEALKKDINKLIEALTAQGLTPDTLKTDSYSLYPVYKTKKLSDTESQEEISKYRAYVRVTCEIYKIADAGKIVDAGLAAGANRVESMDFAVKDQENAKKEALRRAMIAAQEKAQTIANQFNVSLLRPLSISESTFFDAPSPRMYAMKAEATDSMSLPPGTLKVKTRVDVIYEISKPLAPIAPVVVSPSAENTKQ